MTERNYKILNLPGAPGVPIKGWVKGVEIEDEARIQLHDMATLPFIYQSIAVMPDVHAGKGSTVGSVIPTKGAIIPAAVGVDIGCGMIASLTELTANDVPDNLADLRSRIEAAVPHGRTDNGGVNDRGAWGNPPEDVWKQWGQLTLRKNFNEVQANNPVLEKHRAPFQLGTLGTGNHFIEVCLDEQNRVWVMLHSGSRGIGNKIGSHFIELAKKDMERFFIHLPDTDLAYLPEGTEHFEDYMKAVGWAQDYAMVNRQLMLNHTIGALQDALHRQINHGVVAVNCHHNYVAKEHHFGQNIWITRKGAVRARSGDLGIIPGSMGAKSYIVRGKGNPDSFTSCSHGAGRRMSRNKARQLFTLEDHERATAGVECRKDLDVIDETPGAYKDIDAVMAAQTDLVEVVHTLKQVLCVKG